MEPFRVGEWLVEPALNSLSGPDRTLRLEPKVMQVLVCLAEHPGKVTLKHRLLESVWPGTYVTEDVLTRAISALRHALGDDPKRSRFIETIPKGGYRLVMEVTPASDRATAATEATGRSSSVSAVRQTALLAAALAVVLAGGAWGSLRWLRPQPAVVTGSRLLTHSSRAMFPDRRLMHFPGLATDGTRVYFSRGSADSSWGEELAEVVLGGGRTRVVPTPSRRQIVHYILPDRSKLLVQEQTTALGLDAGEGSLWALPIAGGGPLRLGEVLAHDAAWSSDGGQLAFASGQDLYLARWDGSNPRKLVTTGGRAYWIRWAPGDAALRFTLTDEHFRTSLWEVHTDGTGLRRLLSDWRSDAQPCCGEWSPAGRHFVFLAYENGRSDIG